MTRVWRNGVAEWIAAEIPLFEQRVADTKVNGDNRYWQGQLDAHRFLSEAIERGDYLCDSGSDAERGDASAAPSEGSQSGP